MHRAVRGLAFLFGSLVAACVAVEPAPPRTETVYGVISGNFLIRFRAADPREVAFNRRIGGLTDDEAIVGMDFRADGRLFAVTSLGRIYVLDPATARVTRIGSGNVNAFTQSTEVEFALDIDPADGRIVLVDSSGEALRIDPATGQANFIPPGSGSFSGGERIAYAAGDRNAGRRPQLAGLAYRGNDAFAIDSNSGVLARLSRRDGALVLDTIGSLGVSIGSLLQFDIAAGATDGLVATTPSGGLPALYRIDLGSGRMTRLDYIWDASSELRAMAVAP